MVFAKYEARQREQLKSLHSSPEQPLVTAKRRGPPRVSTKRTKQVSAALAQLLSSGTDPAQSMRLLAKNSDPKVGSALTLIMEEINRGGSLADALVSCPDLFTPAHIELVRSAEHSGHPGTGFYAIVTQLEQVGSFRKRLLKAIMYPLFIVLFSIAVLPLSRLVSGDLSGYLFEVGWRLVAVLAIVAAIVRGIPWVFNHTAVGAAIRNQAWRSVWPLKIYCSGARSVFCRALAHNLNAGLTPNQAIHGAAAATGDLVVTQRAQRCLDSIQNGAPLSGMLAEEHLIAPDDRLLLAAGEASGSLSKSVQTLGEQYAEAFEQGTRGILSTIGIIVTCVVLILVGMEIYQAYQQLFAYQESIYSGLEQMDGLESLFRGL